MSKLSRIPSLPGTSRPVGLGIQMQDLKESLQQMQRIQPRYRSPHWIQRVEILDTIDEIILTFNPLDHYDVDFIDESESGDDGKWVKHVFKMHNEWSSAAIIRDPVSPPSPVTHKFPTQFESASMLNKVDGRLLPLESLPDVDEYDCDDEDSDSDSDSGGTVNCAIDGVQQSRYFETCNSSPGLNTSDIANC